MGSEARRELTETVRVAVLSDNSVESVCVILRRSRMCFVSALLLCEVVLCFFLPFEVFAVKASTQ